MHDSNVYILADGRDVPAKSPLARWERELIVEYIKDLRKLTTEAAQSFYLIDKTRSCGEAFGAKLKRIWEEDKAKRGVAHG